MSGIGGAVFWDGRPVPDRLGAAMMEAIRHRGPDGVGWDARGAAGLGHALLALRRSERGRAGPTWSPDGRRAIVADASLYNRDELAGQLGDGWWAAAGTDAALILAAVERWGDGAVERLDGDFAFAVWDQGERRLFAARDPFGPRPLVYHWSPESFLFGSEPKQILRTGLVAAAPDDETVAEHLLFRFAESERTFFTAISRLRPGHVLVASPNGVRQRRWWSPDPGREERLDGPGDLHARFRALLKEAVRKRVQVDVPVASELSGGVDSPSIVVLAAELLRDGTLPAPSFSTVSQVYPGLDCDESDAIAEVAALTPFESHLVSPLGEALVDGLEREIRDLDSPFVSIQRGSSTAEARLLREIGARVLLTGIGGDDLTEEWAYFYDLAADRRYVRLVRDAWAFRDATSWRFPEILRDSLRASLSFPTVRAVRRRLRRPPQPPDWINPEFAAAGTVLRRGAVPPAVAFPTRLQQQTFDNVTNPLLARTLEAFDMRAAASGIEPRYPFLDRPLAEFVLGIPYRCRPPGRARKSLLRGSMARDLPAVVLDRRRKVLFDAYIRKVVAEGRTGLRDLLFGAPRWCAGPYVVEGAARALAARSAPEAEVVSPVFWRVATLDLWLRIWY